MQAIKEKITDSPIMENRVFKAGYYGFKFEIKAVLNQKQKLYILQLTKPLSTVAKW